MELGVCKAEVLMRATLFRGLDGPEQESSETVRAAAAQQTGEGVRGQVKSEIRAGWHSMNEAVELWSGFHGDARRARERSLSRCGASVPAQSCALARVARAWARWRLIR